MLTISALKKLENFRSNVSKTHFELMFVDLHLSDHLWNKFSKENNSDLLSFCLTLDAGNKAILIEYININF